MKEEAEDKNKRTFRTRLKECREAKNISRSELAERGGFFPRAIRRFEMGPEAPSFGSLIRLSTVLGTSIDYLVGTKEVEIVSGNVRAHLNDWPKIRRLEKQLLDKKKAKK